MSNENPPSGRPDADARSRTHNGFAWYATKPDGSHCFSKQLGGEYVGDKYFPPRYLAMRCLPQDMRNGNFEFFTEHGLSN